MVAQWIVGNGSLSKWLMLVGAIAADVAGTLILRASVDQVAWLPAVVVLYATTFAMIGLTLRSGANLGVVYGIWGAAGVAFVALLAVPLFNERLSSAALAGIVVIIVGVVLVQSGATIATGQATSASKEILD
ncbi:MAG: SMR family transporter [Acidimicrobiia bacterium]